MAVITFPATQDRGALRPVSTEVSIQRLAMSSATEWQRQIMTECRRQGILNPAVFAYLKANRLLDRCTLLASEGPTSPLLFKFIGVPTLSVLGRAWGRSVLGQPEDIDPHVEFAHSIGMQYVEAIGAGEALFNRISVTGVGRPFVYTHAVYGWSDRGRRAVLSCIDVHTLH
ncbi:hypothetical protein [Azospirillum soli]|uniref:hypothetical protein n=1 Tax=Azospirillum soli TaxID=1304799 RepID=UPI001AE9B4AD|nr:hypothetical protein [Azospirillum soli]MBP2311873.1 hypothetical protein [Azospirillum soli]